MDSKYIMTKSFWATMGVILLAIIVIVLFLIFNKSARHVNDSVPINKTQILNDLKPTEGLTEEEKNNILQNLESTKIDTQNKQNTLKELNKIN